MATYIVLGSFTEQGIKAVKDTVKRTEAARELGKKAGVTYKEGFWTLGAHDIVAIFEAPNDETMTAFMLSLGKLGNVKTQTLRAFSEAEMGKLLGKMI